MISVEVRGNLAVLPVEHAPQLRRVFPKVVEHKGFAFVPFDRDHAKVLRNLGFYVPAPIERDYDWPGQYKPFAHQIQTAAFLSLHKRAFCLNDMGTGKTLAAYWAADWLMRKGLIARALVVAPLSTLSHVHGDTIAQNFVDHNYRSFNIVHGSPKRKRELLAADADFYIINFDGVKAMQKLLEQRDDIDLVIVDELATYRHQGTERWKCLRAILRPEMWVWGLTGMPTPNEPTDAWAQVKLIRQEALLPHYPSFRSFRFAVMEQKSMFTWVAKNTALQTVASIVTPSIRFERKDCIDLPDTTYTTLDIEPTPSQSKAYKEMVKELKVVLQGSVIEAMSEITLRTKLLQISTGIVYDSKGVHVKVDCKPRIDALLEILDEQPFKTIVFCPFKGNVKFLTESLKHYSVAVVTGDTSATERTAIFKSFQSRPEPRILLAHPACMSHGLTLTEASTIVWFAPIDNHETYEQANARIIRAGQRNKTSIIHLAGSPIEREIYRRIRSKQKMQGLLLDLLKTV